MAINGRDAPFKNQHLSTISIWSNSVVGAENPTQSAIGRPVSAG